MTICHSFFLGYNRFMENLSLLSQKVLEFIEPDHQNWNQWMIHKPLVPVSGRSCMNEFVEMMEYAKENHLKVMVAGDYDCDGIMATTIMVDGLRKFGLECGFYIPNRMKEGYGLHPHIVNLAYKKGYQIIITVDNGIKAIEALERAMELGISTIVTDHHTLEDYVPCDLLIHPDELEEDFSTLCGAGVSYECIRALHVDTPYHLMCACVASIGDMMPVTRQTRWIIQNGIRYLNQSHEPHFFSFIKDNHLNEKDIAFQIVPKLNAIGRLSNLANVNNVVRYFLNDKVDLSFVHQVEAINEKRKDLSSKMAMDALRRCDEEKDILFIYNENYHEGIVGLVSGQLNAQFEKPVIVSTLSDGLVRCSMRAPEGFNCMEFLKDFPLFETAGGHKQAAGFTFLDENLKEFRQYIDTKIQVYQWKKELKKTLYISPEELTLSQVKSLDVLRPFGNGFELPSFEIENPLIKNIFDFQNGKHRKYILEQGLQCMDFNQSIEHLRNKNKAIDSLIGSISISNYNHKESVNFTIDSIKYK